MAEVVPTELAGVVNGDEQSKASGIVYNAGIRRRRTTFTSAGNIGTTSDTLRLGRAKAGDAVRGFALTATTNMSAASLAIGTADDPDQYLAAAALPNATTARRIVLPTAEGFAPLTEDEEVIGTISGASIPAGSLLVYTEFSRR
jgi:hypothetical protein